MTGSPAHHLGPADARNSGDHLHAGIIKGELEAGRGSFAETGDMPLVTAAPRAKVKNGIYGTGKNREELEEVSLL